MQLFLQFDKKYLVFVMESIPIYGIIPKIDEYINIKKPMTINVIRERIDVQIEIIMGNRKK
jgi:hypothetical protein